MPKQYVIQQDDLDRIDRYLTSNKPKMAKDYLNKVIVLWDEPPTDPPDPPALNEHGPTHCMWKDCDQPGGRHTLAGVRLCTFHYSQALSSGRVEVAV